MYNPRNIDTFNFKSLLKWNKINKETPFMLLISTIWYIFLTIGYLFIFHLTNITSKYVNTMPHTFAKKKNK